MELPYVHGVHFEAANFAWVAQMRGEARRFLVKKHGFVKSRLCAIEKIEMWRAALSPEALASELKGTSTETYSSCFLHAYLNLTVQISLSSVVLLPAYALAFRPPCSVFRALLV